MMNLMEGKPLAAAVKARAAARVQALQARGVQPRLAVLLVGDNPASAVYVRGKEKDCAECGIASDVIHLPADTAQSALLAHIAALNADSAVHGILVQLPLPAQIDPDAVLEAIAPEKDVDGFTPVNMGRLLAGRLDACFAPCTPAGCMELLAAAGVDPAGKQAVVLGRSNIVGKPMAVLLTAANATVTLCHSKTRDLAALCRRADILVAAIGREAFVTADMVKPGAAVVDVGINRGADGKLHGDVDFAAVAPLAGAITPVPGGVGLMTRAMLMENTVKAAEMAAKKLA